MTGKMEELIERLEKATGPDRELDAEINRHVKFLHRGAGYALHFTSSFDAALRILPKGWDYILSAGSGEYAHVSMGPANEVSEVYGEAPNPAIAFCIAALKARRALTGEGK